MLALGQQTDSAFLKRVPGIEFKPDGTVIVGPDMMTGHAGIFAGGDMVPGERTVTAAVGHGKRAARNIDGWLTGKGNAEPARTPLVSFDMLNLPVFSDADPAVEKELAISPEAEWVRRGRGGPQRAGGTLRGTTLPILRQLFRV